MLVILDNINDVDVELYIGISRLEIGQVQLIVQEANQSLLVGPVGFRLCTSLVVRSEDVFESSVLLVDIVEDVDVRDLL